MKTTRRMALLFISLLFLFPFFILLIISLTRSWTYPSPMPAAFSLENWKQLFGAGSDLGVSFLRSLIIASSVAAMATAAGLFISRSIAYHRFRKLFLAICYFPFMLAPVIYALLINHFFVQFGLSATSAGVILAQLFITLPYSIILLNSFWSRKIQSMEEVCHTLGSHFAASFFRIILPAARPQLQVCFFQVFLVSWFEFGLTNLIGLGQVQTLTLKVYQYIGEANIYFAALSSCVIILPPVLLLFLNKKFVYHTID